MAKHATNQGGPTPTAEQLSDEAMRRVVRSVVGAMDEACPGARALLQYQARALPTARMEEIKGHLVGCELCQDWLSLQNSHPQELESIESDQPWGQPYSLAIIGPVTR